MRSAGRCPHRALRVHHFPSPEGRDRPGRSAKRRVAVGGQGVDVVPSPGEVAAALLRFGQAAARTPRGYGRCRPSATSPAWPSSVRKRHMRSTRWPSVSSTPTARSPRHCPSPWVSVRSTCGRYGRRSSPPVRPCPADWAGILRLEFGVTCPSGLRHAGSSFGSALEAADLLGFHDLLPGAPRSPPASSILRRRPFRLPGLNSRSPYGGWHGRCLRWRSRWCRRGRRPVRWSSAVPRR